MLSYRTALLLPVVLLALMGFQTKPDSQPGSQPSAEAAEGLVYVVIRTDKGDIFAELDGKKAPKTVKNFVEYTEQEFYDGTIWHRVMEGFMIQGGGLTPDMKKKPTNEEIQLESGNGLKNKRGTLAMARTSLPDSATSQFFINHVDNAFLDAKPGPPNGYAVFGRVIAGMDVVDEIATVETTIRGGRKDVPKEVVMIKEVRIVSAEDAHKAAEAEKADG